MADFIRIYEENPNPKEIKKVVNILKKGGLIIYPTDTVYGLGCDITNTKALERIARIKGVKLDKANFSFICHDLSNLSDYVKQIDSTTFKILKRALPGPYTFILPGSKTLPAAFKKKKEVGIRVPNNAIALDIVKALGNPIVSTSIRDDDTIFLTSSISSLPVFVHLMKASGVPGAPSYNVVSAFTKVLYIILISHNSSFNVPVWIFYFKYRRVHRRIDYSVL